MKKEVTQKQKAEQPATLHLPPPLPHLLSTFDPCPHRTLTCQHKNPIAVKLALLLSWPFWCVTIAWALRVVKFPTVFLLMWGGNICNYIYAYCIPLVGGQCVCNDGVHYQSQLALGRTRCDTVVRLWYEGYAVVACFFGLFSLNPMDLIERCIWL